MFRSSSISQALVSSSISRTLTSSSLSRTLTSSSISRTLTTRIIKPRVFDYAFCKRGSEEIIHLNLSDNILEQLAINGWSVTASITKSAILEKSGHVISYKNIDRDFIDIKCKNGWILKI